MGKRLKFEVEVSDALAQEATRMGLLEPGAVQSMLREAVRTRRIERLLEARKKIAAAGLAPLTIEELVLGYAELTTIVEPAEITPTAIDPDDDRVLGCALAAKVDLIVSGDHALLNLKRYHGIDIVTPAAAIERVQV